MCYKVSFNLAIEKNIDWELKRANKEPKQDASSWCSFHMRTELVSSETFVYIGIEPYLLHVLHIMIHCTMILNIIVRASRSLMQWR